MAEETNGSASIPNGAQSRKDKKNAKKKQHRKDRRQHQAEEHKQEEQTLAHDPNFAARAQYEERLLQEQEEHERVFNEIQRKNWEERERQLQLQLQQKAEEEERRKAEEAERARLAAEEKEVELMCGYLYPICVLYIYTLFTLCELYDTICPYIIQ